MPPATLVHRRTATTHTARRLLLILVVTAETPAEYFPRVKTQRRRRHRRHLAQTFDLLREQVEAAAESVATLMARAKTGTASSRI